MPSRDRHSDPRAAEPRGIGTARARDPLRREVQLLGSLLGQVILEQAGRSAYEEVERVRRASISRRRSALPAGQPAATGGVPDDAETLARAFTLFLLLTNLAEEKHRVRVLARRARGSRRPLDESAAAAVRALRAAHLPAAEQRALLARLLLAPVLTAHPTEARRRTVLTAQRRVARPLDRLDDPRLTAAEDASLRAALREELSVLWQTSLVRASAPSPLDEVRSAMAFFDETLFTVTPRLYRAVDSAIDPASGERPPEIGAFLHWGSWIGSDRDGHPAVTADVTVAAARIQSDHLLRAYERVVERLLAALAIDVDAGSLGTALQGSLRRDRAAFRRLGHDLEQRYPGQPYRWALGFMRHRLRQTRARLASSRRRGGYAGADELRADVAAIAESLVGHGATRAAYGSVQDLAWQVDTFGLHLASLELRQHRAVHAAALAALRRGSPMARPLPGLEAAGTVTTDEVLATLRAAWTIQGELGEGACHTYVVSFTERPSDVLDVLELARRSRAADPGRATDPREPVPLDIVPLLESSAALDGADRLLTELLTDPDYRAHLERRGDRQEVMLGYSDSNRELGFLAAAWALYRAQARLVEAAQRSGVQLLLFHGRGGAIGRGGGSANRAVLAQPHGSVDGRLKVTQQGEVVAARFADPRVALRELEQMTHAAIVATVRHRDPRAQRSDRRWWAALDELAGESRAAYRHLVWEDPHFERFFGLATPIGAIASLNLGSRPAARGAVDRPPSLEAVRAIPWVFAWSQARIGLPAWYGLGSALTTYRRRHGARGTAALRRAAEEWPFLASTLDTAAVGLAVADMEVGAAYAALAGTDEPMRRIWTAIADEHARSVAELLALTGRSRLLEAQPWLEQRIALRNPYVDALSTLQRAVLRELRGLTAGDARRPRLERLAQVTISGIAAGLQHTG